jgi:7-keto-8-aminopelargonate synthetase-like enzyme
MRACACAYGVCVCVCVCVCVRVDDSEGNPLDEQLRLTNVVRKCLNLASYNYLGFAVNGDHPTVEVRRMVVQNQPLTPDCSYLFRNLLPMQKKFSARIRDYGVATGSSRGECGTTDVHRELEAKVAEYVAQPDSQLSHCVQSLACN